MLHPTRRQVVGRSERDVAENYFPAHTPDLFVPTCGNGPSRDGLHDPDETGSEAQATDLFKDSDGLHLKPRASA